MRPVVIHTMKGSIFLTVLLLIALISFSIILFYEQSLSVIRLFKDEKRAFDEREVLFTKIEKRADDTSLTSPTTVSTYCQSRTRIQNKDEGIHRDRKICLVYSSKPPLSSAPIIGVALPNKISFPQIAFPNHDKAHTVICPKTQLQAPKNNRPRITERVCTNKILSDLLLQESTVIRGNIYQDELLLKAISSNPILYIIGDITVKKLTVNSALTIITVGDINIETLSQEAEAQKEYTFISIKGSITLKKIPLQANITIASWKEIDPETLSHFKKAAPKQLTTQPPLLITRFDGVSR
jgi:hypothetical protein